SPTRPGRRVRRSRNRVSRGWYARYSCSNACMSPPAVRWTRCASADATDAQRASTVAAATRGVRNMADSGRGVLRSLYSSVSAIAPSRPSAVVAVATDRRRHRRLHGDLRSAEHPGALARREARRQHAIVDLTRDGEAVERRRWQEQALVVLEA